MPTYNYLYDHVKDIRVVGGRKQENAEKSRSLLVSHVLRVGLEPTQDTSMNILNIRNVFVAIDKRLQIAIDKRLSLAIFRINR